jgi:Tryptophan-rich Synechocystis species C-terminal domain/Cadherin-like
MSGPQSLTIGNSWLNVEDGSHSEPASAIVYTVTALPQNGTLTVDGTTLALNGQFTQQQVDDGLVAYTEGGPNFLADSFGFSISDASSDDFGTGTFNIETSAGEISEDLSGKTIVAGTSPVIFFSGPGRNSFTEGTDTTVSYAQAPGAVNVSLGSAPTINGFGGQDTLVNIHSIIGSSHDDTFFSGPGDNLIVGGGGNDHIIGDPVVGDASNTTAGYSGARSDYLVVGVNAAEVNIIDTRPSSPDGTDDVAWVQSFQFSDGTYTFAQLNPIDAIEQSGATILAISDDNYFLYPPGTTTGLELKQGGTTWTDGQWGNWAPIGAEATATGYEVAFKFGSADLYTVWNTDANGNLTANPIGTVSGSSLTLQALETSFHQDLNGDGIIGLPASDTLIETFGSTSLLQTGSNYVFDKAGGGAELHYDGAAFVAGQWGSWTPIGVEATASGYEVAFKVAGADQYTVWDTDANGNILIDPIGTVSGSSPILAGLERSFQQDLNGDGMVGNPSIPIPVESFGSTSLVQTGNDYFLEANGTSSGPALKYGGAAWTDGEWGGWTPIGAEATATGYEVAFNLAGTTQYTVWNTDSAGNITTNTIGSVAAGSSALVALETSFHQDLNGDGIIGDPSIPFAIETSGSTSLTQLGHNFFLYAHGTSNGPELNYSGAPWTTGQWGGWTPIGAEITATGYEVAFKLTGSDLYTVWNTDGAGNITADSIGTVAGNSSALQSLETSFHQDLNGDGTIGPAAGPSAAAQSVQATTPQATITAPASGDSVLTGSAASDSFVFGPHFGNDTISNFKTGIDQVDIDHTLFASVSGLFSHTADNANGNAVITVAAGQSITFQDTSTLALQQHLADFHLV